MLGNVAIPMMKPGTRGMAMAASCNRQREYEAPFVSKAALLLPDSATNVAHAKAGHYPLKGHCKSPSQCQGLMHSLRLYNETEGQPEHQLTSTFIRRSKKQLQDVMISRLALQYMPCMEML